MKKVLIFSTTYYPHASGAEMALREITDRIDDIQFDMITLRFDRSLPAFEKIGNVNVYRIGFTKVKPTPNDLIKFPLKINKLLLPFIGYLKARKMHQANKYDSIWSLMASFNGFAALFFKLNYKNVPYLLTLQEGDPLEHYKRRVRFVYPLYKMIFSKADKVQAISSFLADHAKNMGQKNKIKIIPNAVDIKEFTKEFTQTELKAVRSGFGVQDDEKLLIHTGRYNLKNALDDLIRSLQYLPKNIKLLLIGDGPDKEKLESLTKDLKLKSRVIFHEFVPQKELPRYLKASDIFIRPSLSEGLGSSFLESMAAKVPVVATPVGGIPDFLINEKTGLFCQVRNPKSIANAVKRYFSDEDLRGEIINRAYSLVVNGYNWEKISKGMHEIFLDIMR